MCVSSINLAIHLAITGNEKKEKKERERKRESKVKRYRERQTGREKGAR